MSEVKIRNAPLRHGHAPGHVRETFGDAVEAFMAWNPGESEPVVTFEIGYEPHEIPISCACTLVWNCVDIIPGRLHRELCEDARLDIKSQTYAACARAMRASIREQV